MASTILFPGQLMLFDAADLIEARGWNHMANPYAQDGSGPLSVRGAVEIASQSREWHTDRAHSGAVPPVTADDGLCALADYVIDTVLVPMHSVMVGMCPVCTQCRKHTNRPLTLLRNQRCPDGCELCDEHARLSDPHGHDAPSTEDIVDAWEGFMPHQRDVVSGLRAAASRPEQ